MSYFHNPEVDVCLVEDDLDHRFSDIKKEQEVFLYQLKKEKKKKYKLIFSCMSMTVIFSLLPFFAVIESIISWIGIGLSSITYISGSVYFHKKNEHLKQELMQIDSLKKAMEAYQQKEKRKKTTSSFCSTISYETANESLREEKPFVKIKKYKL